MKFLEFQFKLVRRAHVCRRELAMTHCNSLRTASTEPRLPIDAAAFAPVAPFASRRILF
jgi:hypothetical protein